MIRHNQQGRKQFPQTNNTYRSQKNTNHYNTFSDDIVFSEKNPYDGNRILFSRLMKQLIREVEADPATYKFSKYISTIWKYDKTSEKFDFDHEFVLVPVEPLPKNTSVPGFKEKMQLRTAQQKRNDELSSGKAIIYGKLLKLCTPSFASIFAPWGNEPYACVHYLRITYGPGKLNHSEKSAMWYAFDLFKMRPHMRFPTEWARFQELIDILMPSNDQVLARLRSIKADGLPLQIIPDRLIPALRETITDDLGLTATVTKLTLIDGDQHSRGQVVTQSNPIGATKQINKLGANTSSSVRPGGPICLNCGKPGHFGPQCPQSSCGYCGEDGHRSGQCQELREDRATGNVHASIWDKTSGNKSGSHTPAQNKTATTKGKGAKGKGVKRSQNSSAVDDEDDDEDYDTLRPTKQSKVPEDMVSKKQYLAMANRVQALEQHITQNTMSGDDDSEDDIRINEIYTGSQGLSRQHQPHAPHMRPNYLPRNAKLRVIRIVRTSARNQSVIKFDSGADVHITNNMIGMSNIIYFTKNKPCPLRIETADGTHLFIKACGDIGEFFKGVYVCENVNGTLISIQDLQAINLGVVFPPLMLISQFGGNMGAIIHDSKGEIVGILDRAYETSIDNIRRTGYFIRWSPDGVKFSICDCHNKCILPQDALRLVSTLTTQLRKRYRSEVSEVTTETYKPRQFTDSSKSPNRVSDKSSSHHFDTPGFHPSTSWPITMQRYHSNLIHRTAHLPLPVEVPKNCIKGIFAYGLDNITTVK